MTCKRIKEIHYVIKEKSHHDRKRFSSDEQHASEETLQLVSLNDVIAPRDCRD